MVLTSPRFVMIASHSHSLRGLQVPRGGLWPRLLVHPPHRVCRGPVRVRGGSPGPGRLQGPAGHLPPQHRHQHQPDVRPGQGRGRHQHPLLPRYNRELIVTILFTLKMVHFRTSTLLLCHCAAPYLPLTKLFTLQRSEFSTTGCLP